MEGATCLSVFVGGCLTRTGGHIAFNHEWNLAIKKYSYYTGWRRDRDITKTKKNTSPPSYRLEKKIRPNKIGKIVS